MKQVFELKNDQVKQNCIAHIQAIEDKGYQVLISSGSDAKSLKQLGLYWKHMGEISKSNGDLVPDIHLRLKKRHLHPIYMGGQSKLNMEYQNVYKSIVLISKSDLNIDCNKILQEVLSVSKATVKEMGQYIDSYWPEINEQGIYLTDPQTYYDGEMK